MVQQDRPDTIIKEITVFTVVHFKHDVYRFAHPRKNAVFYFRKRRYGFQNIRIKA